MRPQDIFGAAPKTVLNKPFFHAQDQKAYNVDGGTSIADAWTKRTLNTVIYNDIQGASLASDAVSLPAGVYYVEASNCQAAGAAAIARYSAVFKDGVKALQGVQEYSNTGSGVIQNSPVVSGIITLSTPGTIDLRYYVGISLSTGGLGYSNNFGSITDASIPSIYADLKIWQLDRSLEIAPKAVNGPLTSIPNVQPASPISGLDITTSGQVITVSPGACLDSTEEVAMAITANKTWTVASTANLETYLFLVRLAADGSFAVKGYSAYAGPSSDGTVNAWRFISWAKNNGSGVLMPYRQVGDRLDWTVQTNRPILSTTISTSKTSCNLAAVVPVGLCREVVLTKTEPIYGFNTSYDNATNITASGQPLQSILPVSTVYLTSLSGTTTAEIFSITLRR